MGNSLLFMEEFGMTEKWIIENGKIKDTSTNMTFDSFVEILTVLNGQSRRITELASDNKRLKFQLNDCLNKKLFSRRELEKENEQLKSFIDDLTTKRTGRIDLANGYSYSVSAVLTNWKGDVE